MHEPSSSPEMGSQRQDFARRLKEERKRAEITQEQLGAKGGVSRNSQYCYERADTSPDSEYLMRIAGLVDVHYLLTGSRTTSKQHRLYTRVTDAIEPLLVAMRYTGLAVTGDQLSELIQFAFDAQVGPMEIIEHIRCTTETLPCVLTTKGEAR